MTEDEAPDPEPFPVQAGEREKQAPAGARPEAPNEPLMDTPSAAPRDNLGRQDDFSKTPTSKREAKRKKAKKGATSKPAAPGAGGAAKNFEPTDEESERAIADLRDLVNNLSSLEADLRAAGLRLPQDTGGSPSAPQPEGYDCAKVCELQGAICALEDRICSLAEAHPEDDRYANACERAQGDCQVAKSACSSCN